MDLMYFPTMKPASSHPLDFIHAAQKGAAPLCGSSWPQLTRVHETHRRLRGKHSQEEKKFLSYLRTCNWRTKRWHEPRMVAEEEKGGVELLRDNVSVQRLRQKLKDPTAVLDKIYEKSSDSHQNAAKKGRWIDIWNTPKSIPEAVERDIPSPTHGGNGSESGRGSYRKGEPGIRINLTMPQNEVLFRTSLMSEHVKCGQGRQALRIYEDMQQSGLILSSHTFVSALKACSSLKDLESVKLIHGMVVQSGLESDLYVGTTLVDAYGKCGNLLEARGVFDEMHHRNVVTWNSMILGYAQMEEGEEALKLYARMQQEGVEPNDRTFVNALKACSDMAASATNNRHGMSMVKRCLEQVRAIHSSIVTWGCETDIFVGTMLVDGYAKSRSLIDARLVFDKMPHRNVVSWTAMILGYSQMGDSKEALHLFAQMQNEGVIPDNHTFVGALKACSSLATSEEGNEADRTRTKQQCLKQIRAIHSQVRMSGGHEDIFVGNMLVDAYAKCGSLVDARNVFRTMPQRSVVSWTSLILGYTLAEEGHAALQLYAQMQKKGVVPNERTFVGVLKACGALGFLEQGQKIHADILKSGLLDTDPFVASGLIEMYSKCGSMGDARQVFDSSDSRDVVAWNALISGYARQGESNHVFHLFEMMRQEGVQPNGITLLGLLTVCSHVGLVDQGEKYFEALRNQFGINPSPVHYSCIIDLLGRAGQLEKAMAFVKTIPFPPPAEVWRSLLGACRKWKNVELGQQAFQSAQISEIADPAAFVLMSNIYAGANMLRAATKVQGMRLRSQAFKQRGRSWWTNTGGIVHAFVVGDHEHPQNLCIYEKLQDLYVKMDEEGYGNQLDCHAYLVNCHSKMSVDYESWQPNCTSEVERSNF